MSKPSLDDIYVNTSKEHGFTFPLPTMVEGMDIGGTTFREETTLSYISHQRSTFPLKSGVTLGTRLKLIIDLPKKLSEDQSLKLAIKGRVVAIELEERQNVKKKISVKFESRYIITPEAGGQKS